MFTITKNVEVVSGGQRILLEANDMIDFDVMNPNIKVTLNEYFAAVDSGDTEKAERLGEILHKAGIL